MSLEIKIIITLIFIIIVLILFWRRTVKQLKLTRFQKYSLSTKYGKMTEQFIPFINDYPYNPENFRFIGNPIDGIQFEDHKIILLEFKTANSRLSQKQQEIKRLVDAHCVNFEEYHLR